MKYKMGYKGHESLPATRYNETVVECEVFQILVKDANGKVHYTELRLLEDGDFTLGRGIPNLPEGQIYEFSLGLGTTNDN